MGNLLDCQENCIVQPDSPVIGFADLSVLELDGLRSPFACRAVFDLVFGDLSGLKVPMYELRGYPVRNVTFHRSYSLESFNFDITEQEFRELSKHFSQPLREITTPFHIRVLKVPAKTWAEAVTEDIFVEHGLYSEYRQSNGGGYLLVFDRNHDRGYYRCSPR